MDHQLNDFRQYLAIEIKSKSSASSYEIYCQVDRFIKSRDFEDAYKKWKSLVSKGKIRMDRPEKLSNKIMKNVFK